MKEDALSRLDGIAEDFSKRLRKTRIFSRRADGIGKRGRGYVLGNVR